MITFRDREGDDVAASPAFDCLARSGRMCSGPHRSARCRGRRSALLLEAGGMLELYVRETLGDLFTGSMKPNEVAKMMLQPSRASRSARAQRPPFRHLSR